MLIVLIPDRKCGADSSIYLTNIAMKHRLNPLRRQKHGHRNLFSKLTSISNNFFNSGRRAEYMRRDKWNAMRLNSRPRRICRKGSTPQNLCSQNGTEQSRDWLVIRHFSRLHPSRSTLHRLHTFIIRHQLRSVEVIGCRQLHMHIACHRHLHLHLFRLDL